MCRAQLSITKSHNAKPLGKPLKKAVLGLIGCLGYCKRVRRNHVPDATVWRVRITLGVGRRGGSISKREGTADVDQEPLGKLFRANRLRFIGFF